MYSHIFVAGTFDGLHAGHRFLISEAFAQGERVTIGLTTDTFVRAYKFVPSDPSGQFRVRSYAKRKKNLEVWLQDQKLHDRATVIPISDPYEPAASMTDLTALIVTTKNRKRGEEINAIRQSRSLPPLALIEVPMVSAEDGAPISSTRMRNGEIDHNGRLVMPESMRAVLGKPLGDVLTGDAITRAIQRNRDKIIITVGDVATKTFLDAGITPFFAIIDGKVGRKPFHEVVDRLQPEKASPFQAKAVKSGPGFISQEAMRAIEHCFSSYVLRLTSYVILIDGEEDLLVLPAILHAPIGSVLYYGQPGEGLVEVVVTEGKKQQALALLQQFS